MANLRVGLIGLGMMGRHHARVIREVEGVDLVAVADAYGDPHGVAKDLPVLRNVEELIAAGIDMAVAAVPTGMHEEVGLALAEAGVHTLVEKPIAASTEAGKRLLAAFTAKGLVGAVGHIERFNPALQSLRKRIADGELGEVYQIATRRQGPFPSRIADVGVVKDLGTHDIDLTAWLAQSHYESIFAQTTTRSGRPHEDMVSATGKLDNGIITNHLVNWLSPMKERLTVVTGEKGAFVADTVTADLTFYENGTVATEWDSIGAFRGVSEGNVTRLAIAKPEPLRTEHEAFRDAVLGLRSDVVTMAEGLETLVVAEAVLESARTGQSVRITV
ncbi:putative dehydrogenase [Arthrobacter stackebrandtii]|uniref:Dehydrogenase n=1 Tax=Arthrobacter stackebrandtii TaxID=272161 RepID=A0ABS4YY97_9MICC|nr:Gfo/Idh/MocA family oxidoreductase [Arthrobacter stackebrandtii]MBP2413747.1 putative dehydrogenase [Arthrobacter stackebrandtii]PYG98695.1 dehydrogenase [Arthrobacter stackebrandtii]